MSDHAERLHVNARVVVVDPASAYLRQRGSVKLLDDARGVRVVHVRMDSSTAAMFVPDQLECLRGDDSPTDEVADVPPVNSL